MAKKSNKEAWERKAAPPVVALPPPPPEPVPPPLVGRHEIDLAQPLPQELTLERWLNALNAVAYFDPRRLVYDDGTPRPVCVLDDDTALGLMGLEVEEEWDGRGDERRIVGVTKKYKQADRLRALELIGKHKKWLVERTETSGPDGGPVNVAVVDAELSALAKELAERKKLAQ